MARFLLNPTFDIETGRLLSHDGVFHVEQTPIRMDREIAKNAKSQGQQAGSVAGGYGATASQIGSSIIPGLETQANHPTGYDPLTKGRMLTSNMEAVGGGNAAITGEGNLAALRTRSAGGYAPALAEAARAKGRTLATANLQTNLSDANLAEKKRMQAQSELGNLYGTTSADQLKAMGIQSEDTANELAAKRQGWLQDTEGVLNTISGMGKNAAGAYKDLA
jgi:hypothetical protein